MCPAPPRGTLYASSVLLGTLSVNVPVPTSKESLFEFVDGGLRFRGLCVEERRVEIAGRAFRIAALSDAADLLDQPEFARAFLEEDRAPYGLELWPAALMLAERVLTGDEGAGRSALDLGCGLGLVAMAATTRGWQVSAVDHDPIAVRFAEYNGRLSGIVAHEYAVFDWHRRPDGRRYERVFAADVLYQRTDHVPVVRCVAAMLAREGVALIADPNRSVADTFEATARNAGFVVSVEKTSTVVPKRGVVDGRVFELRFGAD